MVLSTILEALQSFLAELRPEPITVDLRLEQARTAFGGDWFSRASYVVHWKTLSSATASRDLRRGVDVRLLERRGDKASARYRFL